MHDHSRLSPLFYNAETDSGRSDEYKRFRNLTADSGKQPRQGTNGKQGGDGPVDVFHRLLCPI